MLARALRSHNRKLLVPFDSRVVRNFSTQKRDDLVRKLVSNHPNIVKNLSGKIDNETITKPKFYDPLLDRGDPKAARKMGHCPIFPINLEPNMGSFEADERAIKKQVLEAIKKAYVGMKFGERACNKYPIATHRFEGHVNPGERLRRHRITQDRKKTRAQVNLLCKYMLYKNGKFVPGKMV